MGNGRCTSSYDGLDISRMDRKQKKPLMEKKRRKRINGSLDDLKDILLVLLGKNPTETAKLEKADILELTVDFLKKVEFQKTLASLSTRQYVDKLVLFQEGWNHCFNIVAAYASEHQEIRSTIDPLMHHLHGEKTRLFSKGMGTLCPTYLVPQGYNNANPLVNGAATFCRNQTMFGALPPNVQIGNSLSAKTADLCGRLATARIKNDTPPDPQISSSGAIIGGQHWRPW